jgi:hypothetical protein
MRQFSIVLCLVGLLGLSLAPSVMAAAPDNDTYDGRTSVGSLPFTDTVDTSEATTDATDAEANAVCDEPATEASVWYEVTAASDGGIVVDVSGSTYAAGVTVVTGSPGSFGFVTCGPFTSAFETAAGETYVILVFDFEAGAGNGGTLSITVEEIPPPPEIDVTVDPFGKFNARTGSATITGTVTCTDGADFAYVEVQVRQTVGRFFVTGYGFMELTCDGTAQPWSVEVLGDNGLFKGGRAATVTFAVACGRFDCGADFEEHTVTLRR